jgi:hypothetical protein
MMARDGVETYVGEEDHRCTRQNAAVPVFAEHARVLRYERQAIPDARLAPHPQVMRVHVSDPGDDEQQHNADLHQHYDRVEIRRFAYPADEQRRHRDGDQERGQVEQGRFHRGLDPGRR